MHILNFLIIVIILISLLYKRLEFAYIIALLASLACAIFIYAQENLANILFTIAIFNLTPWASLHFDRIAGKSRTSLKERRVREKETHEQLLKERSLLRQSNSQLNTEVSQIIELYTVTRAMSAVLGFEEIFNILGKKLKGHFRFKSCRLILIDEDISPLKVKEIFELKYAQAHARQVDMQAGDEEMLKQSLRLRRPVFIKEKSTVLIPLIVENKFLGVLLVEDLPLDVLENFYILANQFQLEFKRVRLYQKIEELAITDGLTGLFVRRYFLERLEEEIKRSARHNFHLAFLMIDIDHFKQCNDEFGHLTGDVVLREVAEIIKASVREIDLVARFGGEEFSVLLPDTDKIGAGFVAERIRSSIDRHKVRAYDETIKVEVSIGVAGVPQDSTASQQLIDKADQALYRAKQEGRNRVCVFGS